MTHKRVAAIHDISCFGRCSLTVALPILSAAGIETAVIPTAVLSTHTGGFSEYTFRELTSDILPVANHWVKEDIKVDAVYSGYLASKEQVEIVLEAIDLIKKENALIIVDPAMADNGILYGGFEADFPKEMLKLCKTADVLVPNITEAAMLLDVPYKEGPYTKEYIQSLLEGLYEITGAKIVLTGVWFDDHSLGAAVFENNTVNYVFSEKINKSYHGTGDVFASALVSAIINEKDLILAAKIAVNFTCNCIKHTTKLQPDDNYGVCFEKEIPNLIKVLGL